VGEAGRSRWSRCGWRRLIATWVLLALAARADAPAEQDAESAVARESGAPRSDTTQTVALQVGPFSRNGGALPPGWEPLEFEDIPAHTRYTVERSADGEPWVVRARSEAAASGLIRKIDIDLAEYPIVRWRWRIENLIEASDPAQKSGDDYAARLYIAFHYEPERAGLLRRATYLAARAVFGDLPFGAITYIWATGTPANSIVDNAYAGSFVKMIAVESGPERVGEWIEEQRNVYEDYRRAYAADPPRVEGVAIMTDTDNTGERAGAEYGDIVFLTAEAARSAELTIDPASAADRPDRRAR
jgi:hypothetical protein